MSIKFDASHQCVWKHWEDIDKMNACRKQIEAGLREFALKVVGALHNKHKGNFEREEDLLKNGWFQLNPTPFERWKNAKASLLALGIERISAENLHLGNAYPCLSYVYSPYRQEAKNDRSTDQLVSIVPPPPGFEPTFDNPHRGYIFTKELPALTHEDICNPVILEKYFTDPLVTLIEWYEANEITILKAFGVSRGKQS